MNYRSLINDFKRLLMKLVHTDDLIRFAKVPLHVLSKNLPDYVRL